MEKMTEKWKKDVEQYENEYNYISAKEFLDKVTELKDSRSEREVSEALGMPTNELRLRISAARRKIREVLKERIKELKEAGLSEREIAIKLGKKEPMIRILLDEQAMTKLGGA